MIGQQLCGYNVVIFFSISIFEAAHTPLGHIFLQIPLLKTHLKPTPYLKEVGFSLCFRENTLLINLLKNMLLQNKKWAFKWDL